MAAIAAPDGPGVGDSISIAFTGQSCRHRQGYGVAVCSEVGRAVGSKHLLKGMHRAKGSHGK